MAALQNPGDVKSVKYVDLPATNQVAAIWTVNLRSSSDTIPVPGLESTSGVGSLKATTTVSASAISPTSQTGYTDASLVGHSLITIASGSAGDTFVFATLHRVGALNNLTIDNTP